MKDYIVALGSLALSLFVFISSKSFADSGAGLAQDPAYYPTLLVGILVFMSFLLLANTIKNKEKFAFSANIPAFLNVVKVFAALIIFVVAIKYIGFLYAALLFVPGCVLLFKGTWKLALFGGVPMVVIVYYAFTLLLKVPLPTGILFG